MLGLDSIGPRNLLVIDTSTERAAVGVFVAPDTVNWTSSEAARKHGRDLVPSVRELVQTARLAIHDLHVVAVGIGPGSFTGLRIGLTAAKTLAYATSADLVGFDSLEGLAANAPADALVVHVVADAQRGDVYAADFARHARGEPLFCVCESRIESLAAWASRLGGGGTTVVLGPGLASPSIFASIPAGTAVLTDPDCHRPRADRLIELARRLWQNGQRADLHALEPRYLRRTAAEDQWAAAASRSSSSKP
jgi:tRNA threonylcarbamoyladenosine biosynthesis protein TsaB